MEKQQLAVIGVFILAGWVAWLIFSAVRQYTAAQLQRAAQEKLLLRVSSPENLHVFLASTPGADFLRALEPDPHEPWRGIIRGAQTAVVFGVLGIALVVCHLLYPGADGLLPFGIGGVIIGMAFGLSAAVSLLMHRRAGLLPPMQR
jgi:hypothetical protein